MNTVDEKTMDELRALRTHDAGAGDEKSEASSDDDDESVGSSIPSELLADLPDDVPEGKNIRYEDGKWVITSDEEDEDEDEEDDVDPRARIHDMVRPPDARDHLLPEEDRARQRMIRTILRYKRVFSVTKADGSFRYGPYDFFAITPEQLAPLSNDGLEATLHDIEQELSDDDCIQKIQAGFLLLNRGVRTVVEHSTGRPFPADRAADFMIAQSATVDAFDKPFRHIAAQHGGVVSGGATGAFIQLEYLLLTITKQMMDAAGPATPGAASTLVPPAAVQDTATVLPIVESGDL